MTYIKYNFENLEIYNLAIDLVVEIYELTKKFPRDELYGLVSQVKRAVVSVVLNIAEGSCARSKKDFSRFIGQAIGSLVEVKTGLIIAGKLKYITRDDFLKVIPKIDKLFFKLLSFKKTLK